MRPRYTVGRLTRDEEFRRVYRDGTRCTGWLVVLHTCPNGLGTIRLGLSVGRRFGGAVARNRLRRSLREAVRRHRPQIRAGVDIVVVPRAAAAGAAYADLLDGVRAALGTAGVLDASTSGGTAG
jgi:ribonuclease P protein component